MDIDKYLEIVGYIGGNTDDFSLDIREEADYITCHIKEKRTYKKDFYGVHKKSIRLEKSAFAMDFGKALLEFKKRIDHAVDIKRAQVGRKKMLAALAKSKREVIVKEFFKSIGVSSFTYEENKYGLTCKFIKEIKISQTEKVIGVEQMLNYSIHREIRLYIKPKEEVTLDLLVSDFNLFCQQAATLNCVIIDHKTMFFRF